MKHYICLLILISLIVYITSCTSVRYEKYPDSGYAVASWYGAEFHGKPTSSGEIFNMHAMTCAHRSYPFGTKLMITNISTNKKAYCIVNDRGPFIEGRDIDLSYAVAKEIGLIQDGVGRVRIDYSGRDDSYIREVKDIAREGPFTLQIGSFIEISNAIRLKKALEMKYNKVYITKAEIEGKNFYRVRIGKFISRKNIYSLANTLADEGYPVLITGYEEKI